MDLWKPKTLVIGPGGVKGLKVGGFLSPLEDAGKLDEINVFCGVSIGALISLLLISGYKIREIISQAVLLDILSEIESFDINSSIEHKGFISSDPLKKLLSNLVEKKFGVIPTLKGLHSMTNKSLITVTLNVTNEEPIMMNYFEHPDVSCVDAVIFSMNIPFVFYQLFYENKICIDGALANPYPVDYVDDGDTDILGIYMKTIGMSMNSPMSYFNKILNSVMEQRRAGIIRSCSDKCVHVCLEVNTVGTFKMTIKEKAELLVEGYNQGIDFLEGRYKLFLPERMKYKPF
jgi:predicted acylesterase/phospholipase RssA